MTAVSPFAPPRRNYFLRRSSSSIQQQSPRSRSTAAFAFFLLVIRFWKEATTRQDLENFFQRRPRVVFSWFQSIFGLLPNNNTNASVPPPTTDGRIENTRKREIHNAPMQRISVRATTSDQSVASCSLDDRSQYSSVSKRVRENQRLIRSVLHYWFGQYTPENAQKMLWMIASSSVELRKRVDQEIADKFEGLLLELSSTSTCTTTVVESSSRRWTEWCLDLDGLYGSHGKIAAIIVLDQFSRHIERHHDENSILTSSSSNDDKPRPPLPTKTQLDSLALQTAKLFVEQHTAEIKCGMIPLPMHIFSLMPYRHASTVESVEYVQQCVEDCVGRNEQMDAMLGRFRKATNRRMAVIQDKARRTGKIGGGNTDTTDSSTTIVEESSTIYEDENLLEACYFEADLAPSVSHPVHKTIADFLAKQGIRPSRDGKKAPPLSPVILSLSGGVDSMVIASVLSYLQKACGYNLMVITVHIDYANRPESGAEADFVRRYCETLNLNFRCRKIDEVTRGITARDDYERIARELRYGSYREAIDFAKEGIESIRADQTTVGVMLGHHRGDLRENVLSNAHKGCGPLDLSGMTAVSQNDGVAIYRPLLSLEKSFVFDYAHKFGVPYFKDTTPHWSTRGKLRNNLLPLLEEIYGEGSMNNLSNLATESDECRELLYKSMIGPFLERTVRKPMGIIFDTAPWKHQGVFFWKFVIRAAVHSASLGMFSEKSVVSFLDRVKAEKVRAGWLQCRRDYAVYLQDDGKVFVLNPLSFPWHKKDMYNVVGQAVEFGEEIAVGPWLVKSEIVSEKADCPETFRLAQKAVPSMEHLMDGLIEYMVDAPTWNIDGKFLPRPLVFSHFTKASRPMAWKNGDLKLQTTLPLLGNDETASKAMKDLSGSGLVHEMDGVEQTNPTRLVRVTLRLMPSGVQH